MWVNPSRCKKVLKRSYRVYTTTTKMLGLGFDAWSFGMGIIPTELHALGVA
jgi:hypothetical protein